jgi:hypothetical protein
MLLRLSQRKLPLFSELGARHFGVAVQLHCVAPSLGNVLNGLKPHRRGGLVTGLSAFPAQR